MEDRWSYLSTQASSATVTNLALRAEEVGTRVAACPETGCARNQLTAGDPNVKVMELFLIQSVN